MHVFLSNWITIFFQGIFSKRFEQNLLKKKEKINRHNEFEQIIKHTNRFQNQNCSYSHRFICIIEL